MKLVSQIRQLWRMYRGFGDDELTSIRQQKEDMIETLERVKAASAEQDKVSTSIRQVSF